MPRRADTQCGFCRDRSTTEQISTLQLFGLCSDPHLWSSWMTTEKILPKEYTAEMGYLRKVLGVTHFMTRPQVWKIGSLESEKIIKGNVYEILSDIFLVPTGPYRVPNIFLKKNWIKHIWTETCVVLKMSYKYQA